MRSHIESDSAPRRRCSRWSAPGARRPVLALLGAAALAFLLACTRAASGMIAWSRAPLVAIGTVAGALMVAALSLRALGLPSLGFRAGAVALCISLLAVRFARAAERKPVPLTK